MAQRDAAKWNSNEIGIEAGGSGIYYNLYYQQQLLRIGSNKTLNLRFGAAAFPLSQSFSGSRIGFNATLMPNMLFFSRKHAWETGLALGYLDQSRYNVEYTTVSGTVRTTNEERVLYLGPQASYRRYFSNHRFYLRGTVLFNIAIARLDNYESSELSGFPWAGISAGFTL